MKYSIGTRTSKSSLAKGAFGRSPYETLKVEVKKILHKPKQESSRCQDPRVESTRPIPKRNWLMRSWRKLWGVLKESTP